MSHKPVVRRARVSEDVQEAIDYYVGQNAHDAALAFITALEHAIAHIQRHPASGSPRYAHALDLPGLRFWPCKRFPYLVFYVERPDHIDIWRVVQAQRDIPAWLLGDDVGIL